MFSILIFAILFILIIGCTKKEVGVHESVSRVYGAAYWRMDRQVGVCYPIPFNVIVGLFNKLWWRLRQPKFIMDKINKDMEYGKEEEKV
jgi:hypothetical protein